ncbi:non-oxidative hydroxyarylic acid decarboxylases subunit C [Streptomyces sp. NPDC047002]|uniref:non-oxidative hydroxyarylic acid decarboxylases subunit C n=1 Tax=Streptomyces sp. NPDC047002 TaxID=3155475 RepID=UPI003453CC6F
MPYDDLRHFVEKLEESGQLLRVRDEVALEPDLGAAGNALGRFGERAPALWFDNLRGFPGARVVMNVHGSWTNHALALGLPPGTAVREQVEEFGRRWDAFPVPVERRADAPFLENGVGGEDVDIFGILPLFRLNDADGGFYLDKAAVVSRHPDRPDDFGEQNVGTYRLQVIGKRRLTVIPVAVHDLGRHIAAAESRGEDLPIAIALGNEPTLPIVAGMPIAAGDSEFEMSGALRGTPAPITAAPATGLDVPWGAEVVIEGVVEARQRVHEGPFGEFTGQYSGGRRVPVVRVDRISYRTRPIFEVLYLGTPWTEIDYLMGPSTCLPVLKELRASFPEVRAVNAMYTHGLLTIVSTGTPYGGFAHAVGVRTATTRHGLGYCKVVVVVDDFVDPFDLPRVMWAISTKADPGRDVIRLPSMSITPADPGSSPQGISDKLVIDATTPVFPDERGEYATPVRDLADADAWFERLTELRGAPAAGAPDEGSRR